MQWQKTLWAFCFVDKWNYSTVAGEMQIIPVTHSTTKLKSNSLYETAALALQVIRVGSLFTHMVFQIQLGSRLV